MKNHSKNFKLDAMKYENFLKKGNLVCELETTTLKRKRSDSKFVSKTIIADVTYDTETNYVIINYSIKNEEKIGEIDLHYLIKDIENKLTANIKFKKKNPYSVKNLLKLAVGVVALAFIIWATFSYAFSINLDEFMDGANSLFKNSSSWTIFPIIDVIMPGLFSALSFSVIIRVIFNKKVNFFILWISFYVGFFVEQVSPISGPGTVFSLWMIFNFQKTKLRVAEIALSGLMYATIHNFAFVLFTGTSLIGFLPYLNTLKYSELWIAMSMYGFAWGGLAIIFLNIFFVFIIAYSTKFQRLLAWLISLGFKLIKKEDKISKMIEQVLFQSKRLKDATTKLWSIWFLTLTLLAFNLTGLFWNSTSTWVIKNSIHPGVMTWIQSFSTDIMIGATGIAIPSPGNAGITEIFMSEMYYAIIQSNHIDMSRVEVDTLIAVQRSVGHYAKTAGSAIVFALTGIFAPIYIKRK